MYCANSGAGKRCEIGSSQEFKCASASASRDQRGASSGRVRGLRKRQHRGRAFAILFCPGPCSYSVVEPSLDSYSAVGVTEPRHQQAAYTCSRKVSLRLRAKFHLCSPRWSHAELTSPLRLWPAAYLTAIVGAPRGPNSVGRDSLGKSVLLVQCRCPSVHNNSPGRCHQSQSADEKQRHSTRRSHGRTARSLCSGADQCHFTDTSLSHDQRRSAEPSDEPRLVHFAQCCQSLPKLSRAAGHVDCGTLRKVSRLR